MPLQTNARKVFQPSKTVYVRLAYYYTFFALGITVKVEPPQLIRTGPGSSANLYPGRSRIR